MQVFCQRCGYKIRTGEDYCRWCGLAVVAGRAAAASSRYSSFETYGPVPEPPRSFFEGLFSASGRINRRTLIYLILGSIGLSVVLAIVDVAAGTYDERWGVGTFGLLYGLATIWPGIAAYMKRLHDFDMSGWWLLLFFVPVAGLVWFLVLLLKGGSGGTNYYGPQPGPRFAL